MNRRMAVSHGETADAARRAGCRAGGLSSPHQAGDRGHATESISIRVGGFTLLELLVVIAIIGLLSAYVAPRYFGQIGKAEVKEARAQMDALEKALDAYRLDVGRYPTTQQGLNALNQSPPGVAKWAGPYLKKDVPPDPWGRPFIYKSPGEHGEFDLSSLGRDGAPGGSGEDADINNW